LQGVSKPTCCKAISVTKLPLKPVGLDTGFALLDQQCRELIMKKWLGYILKTIAAILVSIIAIILFFSIQSNLRESKTRQEAAPATGKFVQAGGVELFIQGNSSRL